LTGKPLSDAADLAAWRGMRWRRLVLLLFIAFQGWDGLFTWVAVEAHGLAAEGNALLAGWMAMIGPTPTLLAAKLGAVAGGVLLYCRGVHIVLAGLTLLYTVGAIAPWMVHYGTL
jgi:hypothetical protein